MNLNALLTENDSALNNLEIDLLSRIVIDDQAEEVYRLVLLALRRSRRRRTEAARRELAVERPAATNTCTLNGVPNFFSQSMLAALQAASGDRMFMHFRNVTESIVSGRKVDETHIDLRQRVELLDKAQDAILVQDMNDRIIYWNKSAERLYGVTAEEATGRVLREIFRDAPAKINMSDACVSQVGEWNSEISFRHRDGTTLIVESRSALMRGADGEPRSILSINTDITDRRAAETKIQRLAFYDVLTGLPNRLLLLERLEKALRTAVRQGCMGAIFFIDLDDFKTLNDIVGDIKGNLLLQQIAHRLLACVRSGDTVARFGGDEFVVVVEGLSEETRRTAVEARAIGDKLLAAIRRTLPLGKYEYNCTATLGVALFPEWRETAEDLLKRLDLAVYRAKTQARNEMCFFHPEMQHMVASSAALLSDLRRALKNREFELHFQPQVDQKRNVKGAEAFLRWRHPRGGIVPANQFVPLAQEAGLMMELVRWALETACAELAEWSARREMETLSLTVNVGIREFLDSNLLNLLQEVLRESGANPQRLKLEITETSATGNADATVAQMTALKVCEVGFSLDHFGIAHSSLWRLTRFPLDQLKIDRSLVKDVLIDVKAASVVRKIVALGHNLNLSVIAEGVHTEGQREVIEREGCDAYQGDLVSSAMASSQFKTLMAQPR
jgi:diguanylate cyclase (GGDEF)-like protein/PAS domain S-box-containing protein